MAITLIKLSRDLPGMPVKALSVAEPPFPVVNLSGAKTIADVLAAVGVVIDKIKAKRKKGGKK